MVKKEMKNPCDVKKEKPIFLKTLMIIILAVIVEIGVIYSIYMPKSISGHSISDVAELYFDVFPNSNIFLYVQWGIILLILFIVFIKNIGILKRRKEVHGVNLTQTRKGCKTDLDALYIILKQKKKLSVRSIARIFKIKEDLAIEWARILETGELVKIEYPSLGGPIVELKVSEEILEKKEHKLIEEVKHSSKTKKEPSIKKPEEPNNENLPLPKKVKPEISKKSKKTVKKKVRTQGKKIKRKK